MAGTPRRHHYLPQFYLRGFCDPDDATNVWIWSLSNRVWQKRSTTNVAVEKDLYTLTDATGRRTNDAERGLADLEGRVATVLRDKVATQVTLTDEDRAHLGVFVGLLQTRIPAVHESLAAFFGTVSERVVQEYMAKFGGSAEALAQAKAAFKEATGQEAAKNATAQDLAKVLGRIDIERETIVASALRVGAELALPLVRMNWAFVSTVAPHFFVTSDRPVVVFDAEAPAMFAHGLASRKTILSITLSRTLALVAKWPEVVPAEPQLGDVTHRVASQETVAGINIRMGMATRDFVVAPKSEFPGRDILLSHFPPAE